MTEPGATVIVPFKAVPLNVPETASAEPVELWPLEEWPPLKPLEVLLVVDSDEAPSVEQADRTKTAEPNRITAKAW